MGGGGASGDGLQRRRNARRRSRATAITPAPFPVVPGSGDSLWRWLRGPIGRLGGSEREARLVGGESSKIGAAAASSSPAIESSPRLGRGLGRGEELSERVR